MGSTTADVIVTLILDSTSLSVMVSMMPAEVIIGKLPVLVLEQIALVVPSRVQFVT